MPRRAITMGVGTILDAKRIVMLAFGEGKANVIAKALEGPVTAQVSASFLQRHPNSLVVLDGASSAKLLRYAQPWKTGPVKWEDPALARKAVISLALETKKPILQLTEEDYNEGGLQDLLAQKGRAYDTNLNVFRGLAATVTGWPGGKPNSAKRPGDIFPPW